MKPLRRLGMRYPCCHAPKRTFLVAQLSPSPRSTSIPIWGRIMYGNFLPFVSLRTLALGIALLSLAQNNAEQFVPASSPIADPADLASRARRRTGLTQIQKEELVVLGRFFTERNRAARTKTD